MATPITYRTPRGRSLIWPAAAGVAVLALTPVLSGLNIASLSRAPAEPEASLHTWEVFVQNADRGCRWQYTTQANVQIADCGDERESVRVVFENGRVTEYRVMARPDPSAPPRTSSSLGGLSGLQQGGAQTGGTSSSRAAGTSVRP